LDKKHFRRYIKIIFTMGLKERLQAATSQKEVDTLLKEGKGYKGASEAIKRRWGRIAKETLKQFSKDKNAKKKEKR
jgi:deoxyribose-phosphate aldolase|tara:strand:+ start:1071 stop:1298 length:228 start_codon:yes stop_codon:yes gene_type:complete